MRFLILTSVEKEAQAIGEIENARIVVSGVGRTNAAYAVTQAIIQDDPYTAIINAGIAGSLPDSELQLGKVIAASSCIYAEEGMISPDGFQNMSELGFPLGDFQGNAVPVDPALLEIASQHFRVGPIATVATCSGTDEAAHEVARRTGAIAEAMEGAAVVHVANRLNVPAIEIRAISNTTGNREQQTWDITLAFDALKNSVSRFIQSLR